MKYSEKYEENKQKLLKLNPNLKNCSGIYIYTRTDGNGISSFYVGQSINILDRCISHMNGYQHIDLSIKKRGLYSEDNPYGWKLGFIEYDREDLDMMEQLWIMKYMKAGYQCRYNKTGGSQGVGKEKINEFRPAKTYRDGLYQGRKNSSKEISHLFDLHLSVSTKKNPPTMTQEKALEKFYEFLNFHKENREEYSGGD